jgi:hypothetical protein
MRGMLAVFLVLVTGEPPHERVPEAWKGAQRMPHLFVLGSAVKKLARTADGIKSSVTDAFGAQARVRKSLPRYVGHLRPLRRMYEVAVGDIRGAERRVPCDREIEAVPVSSVRGARRGGLQG